MSHGTAEPFTYGNGIWRYAPDLSGPDWEKGLAQEPVNMQSGRLQPLEAENPAAATWQFCIPYIISDASVRINFFRRSSGDLLRLKLSVDKGQTWKTVWECPEDVVGQNDIMVPICEKYAVSEKGPAPPDDFVSPFGRYAYLLKLEMFSADRPEDCRVEAIDFENTVQLNIYSLPQLHPGKNKITVRGTIDPGQALMVTYVWDDPSGKERRNVTRVEQTPFTYEIIAAGMKWKNCVCRSITIEALPAAGQGNHTLVKEKPSKYIQDSSLSL